MRALLSVHWTTCLWYCIKNNVWDKKIYTFLNVLIVAFQMGIWCLLCILINFDCRTFSNVLCRFHIFNYFYLLNFVVDQKFSCKYIIFLEVGSGPSRSSLHIFERFCGFLIKKGTHCDILNLNNRRLMRLKVHVI